MKKVFFNCLKSFVRGGVLLGLSLILFSCGENSGLGSSIDTKAPQLSITYPEKSGLAIRDTFIFYGTCSDDKSIARVAVTVKSLEKSEGEIGYVNESYLATLSSNSSSWSISLNQYDAENPDYFNGWQYADGKYEFSATCYDNAGNNSGTYSKTYEIDNTAPVFIISNPGVIKKSNFSPSAYGSLFTIDGTISDNHTISYMDVKIYDASGNIVSSGTYEGEDIPFYREEEIATAGGTSVQIAQFESSSKSLSDRYSQLHPSDSGEERYYAEISLTDSTQIYQNPPSGSSRSADEIKTDKMGNSTSTVYLYDDVYSTLMSAKNGINKENGGLSASNLKDILAGIQTDGVASQALEILNETAVDTSASEDNRLYFSLNPDANPTYNVNGFEFGFGEGDIIQTASTGNTVSITISAGLDKINIDPSVVRVWMKSYSSSSKPSDSSTISADLDNLAGLVSSMENYEAEFIDSIKAKEESLSPTTISTNENESDWILIYDYSSNNDKSSSVTTKTFSVTLPDGIELSRYYILGITGYDIEGVTFSQNTVYGFEGNTAGVPPTITFESPTNLSVHGEFNENAVFSGTASLSTSSLYISEFTPSLTVTDESTNSVVYEYTDSISRTNNENPDWGKSDTAPFTYNDSTGKWSFDLSKISGLASLFSEKADSGIYWLCTVKITGTSSSGHKGEASSSIHIDTVKPVVTISSITPSVSGSDYFGGSDENTYLNGKITIKGNIEEQNLLDEASGSTEYPVYYDIWASKNLDAELAESDSIMESLGLSKNLGKVYSITKEIDTAEITKLFKTDSEPDPKIQLEIRLSAKDKAGNSSTYSSKTELNTGSNYVVYQETDRPKISFGNADSSIKSAGDIKIENNVFGTSSNNKVQITFSDDDSINTVFVTLYDSNGNKLDDNQVYEVYNLNPYSVNPKKTTYSLNYTLPETEGVYQIRIDAYDSNLIVTDLSDTDTVYQNTAGPFLLAVDSGAPIITVSSTNPYLSNTDSISGSVSPSAKSFDKGTKISAQFLDKDSLEALTPQPAELTATTSGQGWSFPLSPLPDTKSGDYMLEITVEDHYEQKNATTLSFKMDPIAPTIDGSNFTDQTVKLDESSYVTLKANASDDPEGSGIASFGYYLSTSETAPASYDSDSVTWSPLNQTNDGWNVTFDISSALSSLGIENDGTLYAYLAAKDNAGNTSIYSGKAKLTIDKTAPSITVTGFDGNAVSANGSAMAKDSTKTFSVEVADTNLDSLVSDNSSVTVGTGSVSGDVTTYPVTVSWTDSNGSVEDSKTVTFTATDENGRTATKTVSVACDNYAPRVTLNSYNDFASSSLELTGKITDKNFTKASSNFKVYLVSTDDLKIKEGIVTFGTTDECWSATFTGLEEAEYNIVVVATDTFGNKSAYKTGSANIPNEAGFTGNEEIFGGNSFIVDVNAPTLQENSVKIGENSSNASTAESAYVNGKAGIYIEGTAIDTSSGVSAVYILPYEKLTTTTATEENKADFNSETGKFSISLTKELLTKTGTVYARIVDNAGNTNDVSLTSVIFDNTAPKIQSATISDNSEGFTAYKSGTDSSGNDQYYINNSHTFTLSGITTDNLALAKAELAIEGVTIDPITDENKLSEWEFKELNLSGINDGTEAKLIFTDRAGNTAEKSIVLKIDKISPVAKHELDAKGKDLYFRVGDGVGGKYKAGTYGNNTTIQIRGYFTEEGSGINSIYYKLQTDIPSDTDIENFLKNYASDRTGEFISSSDDTQTITKNLDENGNSTEEVQITTNFNTKITGFREGNNYLILVCVDNVGNAKLDTTVYSINVDTVLPEISSDMSSILSNKTENIPVNVTASDADSGLDSVTMYVIGNGINTKETPYTAAYNEESGKYEYAIPASIFGENITSGNYTVYAVAIDKAGEGNKNTISATTITIDTEVPTVTLNSPSDARKTTAEIEVNGLIELSGTLKDGKNALNDDSFQYLEYNNTASDAVDSEWTKLEKTDNFMNVLEISSDNSSYSITNFNTTDLEDEKNYYIRAVAKDVAGNIGKSSVVTIKVSQNTDRPVLNFTNITKNSSGQFILKNNDSGTVEGTITDDDSTGTQVVKSLTVKEYNSSDFTQSTINETEVSVSSSGDFSFSAKEITDGEKYFTFEVIDNANKTFASGVTVSDSDYTNVPVLSVKSTVLGNSACAESFSYRADNESPVIESVYAVAYDSDGVAETDSDGDTVSTMISAAYYAGGTERKSVVLTIDASDKNGIAGMTVVLKNGNTKIASYKTTNDSAIAGKSLPTTYEWVKGGSFSVSGTNAIWELPSLDVSGYTGSITLTITPYDNSGLTGNSTQTFSLDNEGPTVTITSHKSYTAHGSASADTETQYNGIVTLVGSATDTNEIASVQWYIPKSGESASENLNWQGEAGSAAVSYTFSADTLLDVYSNSTYCTASGSDSATSTTWYAIPIYFRAVDEWGNVAYTTDYTIKFNPDLDKPITAISNPSNADALGGTVRTTGTARIPDGAQSGIGVSSVYVQVGSSSSFPSTDKTTAQESYGYTIVTGYDLINESAGTEYSSSSQPTLAVAKKYGFASLDDLDAWWGIKTTTSAWKLNLNEDGELNPTGDSVNTVYLRAAAVNSNGKLGSWCSSIYVTINNKYPDIDGKLYQFTTAPSSSNVTSVTTNGNVIAEKSYESGMYIKGQWYIECTATEPTDGAGVSIESITKNNVNLTAGTDYFISTDNDGTDSEVKVYITVDKDATSTSTYKVTAYDKSKLYSATATYSINVDNTAPTVDSLYSDSDRTSSISMTKIENSNYVYHIYGKGTDATSNTDTGSGVDFIAYYFRRTANGTTTIELPLPSGTVNGTSSSTGTSSVTSGTPYISPDLSVTEDGLYGVKDTDATYSSYNGGTKISSSLVTSENSFIRKGGAVKLSGSYYAITEVGTGYVAISETFGTAPSYAFFPAAIIVNNTTAETGSTSSGTTTISNDDGDGFVDYLKKNDSGSFTWETEFFSDELEDGQIEIVVLACDKAGNYTDAQSTKVMLTNHKPRVSKVYLATDLNGNGSYTDNELGSQSITSSEGGTVTGKFYSALSGATYNATTKAYEGSAQQVVTLSSGSSMTDSSGSYYGTGLTMRNKLGVSLEFVGGNEGTGDLYYQLDFAKSTDGILTTATSGTAGKLAAATSSLYDTTSDTTTASIVSSSLKGFEIETSDVDTSSITEWVEATASTHVLSNIGVTIWDSTKGTTAGTGDTYDADGNYASFGSQWTVINMPIYIDLVDDQKPVPAISDPTEVENAGHVELGDTLPSIFTSGNATAYLDRDTKISGEVTFTGTITDEKRVDSITLTTSKNFNSTAVSSKTVASYSTRSGEFTVTQPATGLTFAVTSNEFTTAEGHKVGWSLTVDSSYVEGIAATDVVFTVAASDGTNSADKEYQVDVVPYITGIIRLVEDTTATSDYVTISETKYVDGTTNRSRYGDYAVVKGEYLKVDGYNLPSANVTANATDTYVHVGGIGLASTNITSTKEFVIAVPENSGELTVSVNNILSLNDKNNNTVDTNLEKRNSVEFYYDNRYLRTWDINHQFTNIPTTATTPAMAIGNDGSLYGQYVRGTDAQVILINGLDGSGRQIFRCYDQPLNSTALAVDTKATTNGGGASSMFFMANVGNSGTVDSWAMTDVANTGSVAAIGLTSAQLTNSATSFGTGKVVTITGNPLMRLDSNVQTSFYPLASYSMKREITPDLLTSPRTAKYGTAMHNVFYDSQTKGLKYSYVNTTSSGDYMEGSMAGWVVIDGGYNGQDRLHTWSTSAYTTGQYGLAKRGNNNNTLFTSTNNNTNTTGAKNGAQGAAYSNDLIQLTPGNKSATSCTVTVNNAAYWSTRLVKGSTIAFLTNGETYTIDLTEITNVTNNGTTFTLTYNNCPAAAGATYATIYTGAFNVVGLTAATAATKDTRASINERSNAAGKYSDIDVTTGGYPVIAYFDSKNETVRVAYATSTAPTNAANWNRVDIPGVSGGTHVSMRIDPNNVIHIMYRNSVGAMEYVKGTIAGGATGAITGITFGDVETIDSDSTTGTYGSISVIYNFESSDGSYTPCVTYLNSEETENALKYAVRRKIDDGNDSYKWDAIIMPATERYAVGGSRIYLGGKSSAWTTVSNDGVSVADCYSTVGYLSSGMDVVFLKSEK
mgnify:CR=1 FL=1